MTAKIRAEDFLEVASVMILVLDRDGCINEINKKGTEILGYDKGEVEGKNYFDAFVPEETRLVEKAQFRFLVEHPDQQPRLQESKVQTKAGEERWINWDTSFICNDGGTVQTVLRSGQDVTEKRALQKKLAAAESEKRKSIMAAVLEAQENERLLLARELHDGVSQVLTTCKLLLELEMQQGSSSALVKDSYKYLVDVINDIRLLSHQLNPAQLEEIGLEGSVRELVKGVNATGKVAINLIYQEKAESLDREIALTLFRITQEGINNILKYAEATEVVLSVCVSSDAAELEIKDNGKGFDKERINRGLGLKNISSRVDLYNGYTHIVAAPGEGCTLSVFLPLSPVY